MTLQQLEYIIALDTHRHFVKASEACYVTQPTLTTQVKKLEEEFGVSLFDRSKQPLKPTKEGEKIIAKAREILRESKQLMALVEGAKEELTGDYRIGIIPTIAPYLLPLFIKSFVEKYPHINLSISELQTHRIVEALKKDQLDIGILVTPLDEDKIQEIPLYEEPFLIYASDDHPLMQQEESKMDGLPLEGLWLLNQGHCFRDQVLNICGNQQRVHSAMGFDFESGSIETLKNMVRSNLGYTLVPELSIHDQADQHFVKRFVEPEPIREVSMVTLKSFAKTKLLKALKEEIQANIPEGMKKSEPRKLVRWR